MSVLLIAAVLAVLGWLLAEAGAALLRAGRKVDDIAATVHDPHLYDRPWEDR